MMLIRVIVRSSPDAVFRAEYPCIVHCWVCARTRTGEENAPVAVMNNLDEEKDWAGCLLPMNVPIQVEMDPGDFLYAISKNQSELSLSVIRR